MSIAFLIVAFLISVLFCSIWVTRNSLNCLVKITWGFLAAWSVYELLILLGKIPSTDYNGFNALAWTTISLAGLLGIIWKCSSWLNVFLKVTLLATALFGLVVVL